MPQPADRDFGELVRGCHDCPDSFSVLGDNGVESLKDRGVVQMKCDLKRTPLADRDAAAASARWHKLAGKRADQLHVGEMRV